MTEFSRFWDSSGTGDGDAGGVTEAQWNEGWRAFAGQEATNLGAIFPDYLNELAPTGSSTPVAINTGAANVYGFIYTNSASVDVAVGTPSGDTRIDRIVLRASWSAQTVRITLVAGSEGGAAPALTQSASTTWDIPICQVSITTGGSITLTDERGWLNTVGDGDITLVKMAVNSIDSDQYVDASIDTAHIAADQITSALIADDQVDSEHIAAGGVDLEHMSANSVDSDQHVDGSIDRVHLEADIIDGTKIEDNAVDTEHLADDAVGAAELAAASVDPRASIQGVDGIVIDPANGDARGTDAVDLQTNRAASSQVASGLRSVVSGGNNNTAGGDNSAIGGGAGNTATGQYSFAHGQNSTNALYASYAHSNFGRQYIRAIAFGFTPNATPKEMFLTGSTRLVIPSNRTWFFTIKTLAGIYTGGDTAAYKHEGVIQNSGGTVALKGSVIETVIHEDDNTWSVAVTASDANDALVITATGDSSSEVDWVFVVNIVQGQG